MMKMVQNSKCLPKKMKNVNVTRMSFKSNMFNGKEKIEIFKTIFGSISKKIGIHQMINLLSKIFI